MIVKVCKKCNISKPLSEFYKDKGIKSGFKNTCKKCEEERRRIRKEKFGKNIKKRKRAPANTNNEKYCLKCEQYKLFSDFEKNNRTRDGLYVYCRECHKLYSKKYHYNNRDHIITDMKNKRQKIKNATKTIPVTKTCLNCKKDKNNNEFHKDNCRIDGLSCWCKHCRTKYVKKPGVKLRAEKLRKKRVLENVHIRIRGSISSSICRALKKSNNFKTSSISNYLPYTILELKSYIESLWESWMNWDNWGQPDPNRKTWQIDHIIPQSKLPYDSMEHPNFLKCWKLENLQPLETIENIKKGNNIPD